MTVFTSRATRALCLLCLLDRSQGTNLLRSTTASDATRLESELQSQSQSRALQDNAVPLNEGWLNQLIVLVLPSVNSAIQQFVPDPLGIDLAGDLTLGSVDLGCGDPVTAGFSYAVGGITGLSSIFIDVLEVITGTDSIVGDNCWNQLWNATFNMAVSSVTALSVDDLGAAFTANGCGLSLNPGVGGTILTQNPTLTGSVEMAGNLCAGGFLTVNTAKILDTLQVAYSSIGVELEGVPPVFSSVVNQIATPLTTAFEPFLTNVMEPAVRSVVQQQLAEASIFAPLQILPIQAAMARNNIQSTFQNLFRSDSDGGGE